MIMVIHDYKSVAYRRSMYAKCAARVGHYQGGHQTGISIDGDYNIA